jgi:hypothetical protein
MSSRNSACLQGWQHPLLNEVEGDNARLHHSQTGRQTLSNLQTRILTGGNLLQRMGSGRMALVTHSFIENPMLVVYRHMREVCLSQW